MIRDTDYTTILEALEGMGEATAAEIAAETSLRLPVVEETLFDIREIGLATTSDGFLYVLAE